MRMMEIESQRMNKPFLDLPSLPNLASLYSCKSSDEYEMIERRPIHPMTKKGKIVPKLSDE